MSDPQNLRETNWRRPLTQAEEADLRARLGEQPEVLADWEQEKALTEALNGMSDVPVSSNFTARVVQALELEKTGSLRTKNSWWSSLLPRLAFGGAALGLGALIVHLQLNSQRLERARSVATVSEVAPDATVLQDFNAIHQMGRPSVPPDEELLALAPLLAEMQ